MHTICKKWTSRAVAGISLALAALTMVFNVLTLGIDAISHNQRQAEDAKQNILFLGAYARSQDIANDGTHFYFSARTMLSKTELDGETTVKTNVAAIPYRLYKDYGIKHIGGISCYGGKVYAGLEDSKVWQYPIVGVYNAQTLQLESYYILDSTVHTRGLPWVCVDPATGYLWAADHSKQATELFAYDTNNNMAPVARLALDTVVPSIQGAEFWEGDLYAACNDDTQAVYRINMATGQVTLYFERNLTNGSEGEGITALRLQDGTVFHAVDMGPLFINAFIRHYKPLIEK